MRLYLVRHGEALPKEADGERRLSANGEGEVRRLAAFLKPKAIVVGEIWHSGKARARQTAEGLSRGVQAEDGVLQHDELDPLDDPRSVRGEVARSERDVLIVGHMPFLSRLGSSLLSGDDSADFLALRTAGAACLEREEERRWHLLWQFSPALLGP